MDLLDKVRCGLCGRKRKLRPNRRAPVPAIAQRSLWPHAWYLLNDLRRVLGGCEWVREHGGAQLLRGPSGGLKQEAA